MQIDKIQPEQRKKELLKRFDHMNMEESIELSNSSDPKPLLLAAKAQIGSSFTWHYEESGPEKWRVKITKVSDPNLTISLGELVAMDFRKADVFLKSGIDFCCHGDQTLEKACADAGVETSVIIDELLELDKNPSRDLHDFNNWTPGFLADYIVNIYHAYVRNSMPELLELSAKVYRVHGGEHPELEEVYSQVKSIAKDLEEHMLREENQIFPYIYVLSEAGSNQEHVEKITQNARTKDWHKELNEEHEEVGDAMKKIKELTHNYALPPDACTAYKLLYSRLLEFEEHLFKHVHLENNILFPKALELEGRLGVNNIKHS